MDFHYADWAYKHLIKLPAFQAYRIQVSILDEKTFIF